MTTIAHGTDDKFRVLLEAAPDAMIILNQTTWPMNSELGLWNTRAQS
jgi:hypothetical protein